MPSVRLANCPLNAAGEPELISQVSPIASRTEGMLMKKKTEQPSRMKWGKFKGNLEEFRKYIGLPGPTLGPSRKLAVWCECLGEGGRIKSDLSALDFI